MGLLLGYGASAINPYLAFETLADLAPRALAPPGSSRRAAVENYIKAAQQGPAQDHVQDGHLDAAELPQRPGLRGGRARHERRRPRTSRARRRASSGIGLDEIAAEAAARHAARVRRTPRSAARSSTAGRRVPVPQGRRAPPVEPRGDRSSSSARRGARPVPDLQAVRALINDQSRQQSTLRGLFGFKPAEHAGAARRGRAGRGDRQAVRHRRHVASAPSARRRTRRWPSP